MPDADVDTAGSTGLARSAVTTTVVVVTWQGAHLLRDCLMSVAAQTEPHRVLVVDNASTDGTAELLAREFADVEVIRLPHNTGFSGGVHAALAKIETEYVALLNNDAKADPQWLASSVRVLREATNVAAVTAKMLLWNASNADPIINNAGVRLTSTGYGADRGGGEPDAAPYDMPEAVFGFSGGAAVARTEAVRAVGGMPAEFFLYYEDTDLSWRLRLAGWEIRYEPTAIVWHRHAASTDQTSELFAYYNERNRMLMLLRCAPASFATAAVGRFVVTTVSLALRRVARQRLADAAVFRIGLRLRALAGVARLLPWALSTRKNVAVIAVAERGSIIETWVRPRRQLS